MTSPSKDKRLMKPTRRMRMYYAHDPSEDAAHEFRGTITRRANNVIVLTTDAFMIEVHPPEPMFSDHESTTAEE